MDSFRDWEVLVNLVLWSLWALGRLAILVLDKWARIW